MLAPMTYQERPIVKVAYLGVCASVTLNCGHSRVLVTPAYPGLLVACVRCPVLA